MPDTFLTDELIAKGLLRTPPQTGRILLLSDSFGEQQSGNNAGTIYKSPSGIAQWVEMLSGGAFRFDITNNKGVTGNTTSQMLARYDADVKVNLANFDILFIDGGRNDPTASKADADLTIANLIAIAVKSLRDMRLPVMFLPNVPRSFAPNATSNQKLRAYVNEEVRKWCRANGVAFVDYWRDIVDPTVSTGAFATGMSPDVLHLTSLAGYYGAKRTLDVLAFQVPKGSRSQSAWDIYDATLFPTGNIIGYQDPSFPRFAGTAGFVQSGVAGQTASGYSIATYSGTGAQLTASKIAAAAGYDNVGGDKQRIATTGNVAVSGAGIQGEFGSRYDQVMIPTTLQNKQVFAEIEVEQSGFAGTPTQAPGLALYLKHNDTLTVALLNGAIYGNEKLLLRTPALTVPADGGNKRLSWSLAFLFPVGWNGALDVSNAVMRPLA